MTRTQTIATPETSRVHAPGEPDAASLTPSDWPYREITSVIKGERRGGFEVVVSEAALQAMLAHGRTTTSVEVGGVMVGDVYRDHLGCYLLIHATIPAGSTRSDAAHVTFTTKTWTEIHTRMDASYPDSRIAGWYHTHPDFGVFLSDMDLFIQRNFFDEPWQVAFVYDPVRSDEGMFVWRGGQVAREPIIIERVDAPPAPAGFSVAPERSGAWFWAVFLILATVVGGAVTAVETLGITGEQIRQWIGQ